MFKKQAKPRPSGVPAPINLPPPDVAPQRKSPKVASVIADDITIDGGISGEGEIHIDGVVRGDVRVGRLTLGETGHVEGSVYAELAEIRGRVVGSITAKQVRLFSTSYVDGDITHEALAMETGAFFQGRSLKLQRPAAPRPEGELKVIAPAPQPL